MEQQEKITALYCRTTKQDPADLAYQRTALQDYAKAKTYGSLVFYEDYGCPATDPVRPAFTRLEQDIHDGKVARVLAMGLPSLGRNTQEVLKWARAALEQGTEVITLDTAAASLPERFAAWLAAPSGTAFTFTLKQCIHTVIRVRKNADFDYLYFQRNYNADGIERRDSFQYAGMYCGRDGLVYDRQHGIEELTEGGRGAGQLMGRLEADVRGAVEAAIGNNRNNLTVKELTTERNLERLDHFVKHGAAARARELFLQGGHDGAFPFCCDYSPVQWTESSLLEYILDPPGYAAREAAAYMETHQEAMLDEFLTNDALAAEYAAIAGNPRHPAQRVKRILDATCTTAAKTLRVTICKDDVDFSFKVEANDLRRDCGSSYAPWRIAAADRREFEKTFGHSASYGPEDILRIEHGRTVIYEAEVEAA